MDFSNIASQLNVGIILPEGIVVGTLLVVLIGDLIGGRASTRWTPYATMAGLFAAIIALVYQWDTATPMSFLGSYMGDDLSIVFRGIIALSAIATVPMSIRYVEQTGTSLAEFLVILMTATLGGMFLSGANDLVTIFVALETLSISSYLLTGYMKRDPRSNEAALKYLLIGAASSAIFLYGVSLLYGLSGGKMQLADIAASFVAADVETPIGLVVALVFVIAGIAFKIAAVPFHQWTPDVYEGSPTPVVAFLSVGSKAAGFALAIRLLVAVFPLVSEQWHFVFTALAILSMVLGNVVALAQDNVKRLLAYSTVSQVSYIVLGAALFSPYATIGGLVHLVHQGLMKITLFFCAGNLSETLGIHKLSELDGTGRRMPLTMAAFTIAGLGMMGLPPVAGFVSEWYLGVGAIAAGEFWALGLLLTSSLLNAIYFLPPIHRAWFRRQTAAWPHERQLSRSMETRAALLVPTVATTGEQAFPGFLIGQLSRRRRMRNPGSADPRMTADDGQGRETVAFEIVGALQSGQSSAPEVIRFDIDWRAAIDPSGPIR